METCTWAEQGQGGRPSHRQATVDASADRVFPENPPCVAGLLTDSGHCNTGTLFMETPVRLPRLSA